MAKCTFLADVIFKLVNWKQIITDFSKNNTNQLQEQIKDMHEIVNGLVKVLQSSYTNFNKTQHHKISVVEFIKLFKLKISMMLPRTRY